MPSTLSASGFTPAAFEAFLAARSEPGWLVEARRRAWAAFLDLGMPSRQDEEWARTDIRLFRLDRFGLPDATPTSATPPPGLLAQGVTLGGQAITLNSAAIHSRIGDKWAAKGVLFGSIESLLAEHGDLLRPFFERRVVDPYRDKFSALNAASWAGGALLYVPPRVSVDEPFHALSGLTDGGVDLTKTLVILDRDAEATMLSETASIESHAGGLHCGSIELLVEPGARLRYVNLQHWGDQAWHFAHQKAHVASRGSLQWTIGALGSRLAKVNQHVALTGEYAEAQVNGVMFTQGRQHLSYNTHQHHQAAHCRSDLLYKAALQDESRTVWRGMIKVDRGAQKTDGYQRNDNLMLARTARADSIPGLEIEADDVRCTHGSTSGRLDDQQIFYAMTRGYTRQEAVRMIVAGFFQQVFDRITIESVRDALGEAIGRRVRAISQ
jgi:Fe-S cluster assembly protein SufD